MSTSYETASGQFHVQVKLHGDERKIQLFHKILHDIESDWAFHRTKWSIRFQHRISVCPVCKGIVLNNPRIAPPDIKALAAQVGVGCKIYTFAKAQRCGSDGICEYIERKDRAVLYSHKPGRINLSEGRAWVGDNSPVREQVVHVMPGAVTVH